MHVKLKPSQRTLHPTRRREDEIIEKEMKNVLINTEKAFIWKIYDKLDKLGYCIK